MSWSDNFVSYTTGMAFNIGLSHDYASVMQAIVSGNTTGWRSRNGRSTFIPVVNGLIRRGLVEHNSAARIFGMNTPHVKLKWIYRLTPAGHLVFQLMQMAGVVHDDAPEHEEVSA